MSIKTESSDPEMLYRSQEQRLVYAAWAQKTKPCLMTRTEAFFLFS